MTSSQGFRSLASGGGFCNFLGFWKNTGGVYYCLPEGDGVVVVGDGRAGGG